MTQSFADKWSAARKDLREILHDKTNKHFKYGFTSGEAVKFRVGEALASHGIFIKQAIVAERPGSEPKFCKVSCDMIISDGTAEARAVALGDGMDGQDKGIFKAQSCAYREALVILFSIPRPSESFDVEDEGEDAPPAAAGNGSPRPQAPTVRYGAAKGKPLSEANLEWLESHRKKASEMDDVDAAYLRELDAAIAKLKTQNGADPLAESLREGRDAA